MKLPEDTKKPPAREAKPDVTPENQVTHTEAQTPTKDVPKRIGIVEQTTVTPPAPKVMGSGARVFHMGLNLSGQKSLCAALATIGEYVGFDWHQWFTKTGRNKASMMERIKYIVRKHRPGFIFLQIQNNKVFTPLDIQNIISWCPTGVQVLNWSGDIRPEAIPWFTEVSKILNVCTAFSDMDSVRAVKATGECARHLPIGYEETIFNEDGEASNTYDILFTGTLYPHFPLYTKRMDVMKALFKRYGKKVGVFGGRWNMMFPQYIKQCHPVMSFEQTANLYRGSKIVVGINNYQIDGYTSDRMFNAAATGTVYLPMRFKGIEQFYTDGEHTVYWNDISQLTKAIDELLADDDRRRLMGMAGAKHTRDNHRWINRINTIREWMEI